MKSTETKGYDMGCITVSDENMQCDICKKEKFRTLFLVRHPNKDETVEVCSDECKQRFLEE